MGFIRKCLAWLSVPVICLLFMPVYLLRPFNPDNNRLFGLVVARVGRFFLGMKRPIEGTENIPKDRPVVMVANHQHNDDLFVVADLLPRRTVTVGKSALIWVPFFGQVFWLGGNVILNRAHSIRSVAALQATTDAITTEDKSVWIFPEGTRSHGKGLQNFKKGAFHVAIASGAPIVPVCASIYHDRVTGLTGRRESVSVRVLPPLETSDLTRENTAELMARCHRMMEETIATL
jgi:1-acyl-sn-glycerol-3-phosphate acyltransferase